MLPTHPSGDPANDNPFTLINNGSRFSLITRLAVVVRPQEERGAVRCLYPVYEPLPVPVLAVDKNHPPFRPLGIVDVVSLGSPPILPPVAVQLAVIGASTASPDSYLSHPPIGPSPCSVAVVKKTS